MVFADPSCVMSPVSGGNTALNTHSSIDFVDGKHLYLIIKKLSVLSLSQRL